MHRLTTLCTMLSTDCIQHCIQIYIFLKKKKDKQSLSQYEYFNQKFGILVATKDPQQPELAKKHQRSSRPIVCMLYDMRSFWSIREYSDLPNPNLEVCLLVYLG